LSLAILRLLPEPVTFVTISEDNNLPFFPDVSQYYLDPNQTAIRDRDNSKQQL
jgi:hypothetical protein